MTINTYAINICINQETIAGVLQLPINASSLVIFAHGSGSSRFSSRNLSVAKTLNETNIATLLFDLLTPRENDIDQATREYRFNIDLLSSRLITVTDAMSHDPKTQDLAMGYFGASTGAAAAIHAAAERPALIKAIVSRGGRPDLAEQYLARVKAPALLIAGGLDTQIVTMNQQVMQKMTCTKVLEIIPGATHLFEEPGTLDQVTELAKEWFTRYL